LIDRQTNPWPYLQNGKRCAFQAPRATHGSGTSPPGCNAVPGVAGDVSPTGSNAKFNEANSHWVLGLG